MKSKILRWFVPRIPAIAVGAAAGLGLNHRLRQDDNAYAMLGSALIGAMVGTWIHKDVRGLLKALRSGAARRAVVWTLIAGIVGGTVGLLVRRIDDQAATRLPWLFSATLWTTWLRCALIGAVLGLLEIGDHYDAAIPATPK